MTQVNSVNVSNPQSVYQAQDTRGLQQGNQTPAQQRDDQIEVQSSIQTEQRRDDVQRQEGIREESLVREQQDVNFDSARIDQRQLEQQRQEASSPTEGRPDQIIPPTQDTVRQLEQNTSARQEQTQNANGLGRTAINSYNSLDSQQQSELIRGQISVDITA